MQELKTRQDMIRFIKRCMELQGKNPWNWAYRNKPNKARMMSDEELKKMAFDYALNFEGSEDIDDLDGRTNRFKRGKEGKEFSVDWRKYRYDIKKKQD